MQDWPTVTVRRERNVRVTPIAFGDNFAETSLLPTGLAYSRRVPAIQVRLPDTLTTKGGVMTLVRMVKRMKQQKSLKKYAWYGWI